MTHGLLFPPPTLEFSFFVWPFPRGERECSRKYISWWLDALSRGGEGRKERENSFLSRPLINPLSSGPPCTLDGAHHVPPRTELVIHQPLLSYNGVFFFFRAKIARQRNEENVLKYRYTRYCVIIIQVSFERPRRSRTNISLLFFFFEIIRMETRTKEELLNFFFFFFPPNYLTIVSILS